MLCWFSASGCFLRFFSAFTFVSVSIQQGPTNNVTNFKKLLSKWIQGVCSDPNRVPTQVSYCHVMLTDFSGVFFLLVFFFFPLCEWKEDIVLSAAKPQYWQMDSAGRSTLPCLGTQQVNDINTKDISNETLFIAWKATMDWCLSCTSQNWTLFATVHIYCI